eukprot:CAMPEP_0170612418 /NCGR_PEP_ID=MMETSP0224-20130122/23714_1 /TAXON_ID=285029 /ORGANISM="Togula jolla, Strain CCCM 725" /LENGTH=815 /DNA_ID=CAMNT_0010937923 /DNA_START=35 /DNA_END=2482 /DNA_ORIENTATION=+
MVLPTAHSPLKPRPYQLECLRKVQRGNTIVSLPTGGGKTLVGVLALDHFLCDGGGPAAGHGPRAMFVVPTRVLVAQQAQYCRDRCSQKFRVVELSGNEMEGWTKAMWVRCIADNDVLVGTPEVFRRALVDAAFLSVLDFALIIFDECHNATGNSPMAAIMRDAVWPVARNPACPRILGLTAIFVNGSLKNLENKRQQLEALLQASLFCPEVPADVIAGGSSGAAAGTASTSRFHHVSFVYDVPAEAGEVIEEKLAQLVSSFEATFGMPVKETGKLISRTKHVLEELGMSAFYFALREGIIPQLEAHAAQLAALGMASAASRQAGQLNRSLPKLRTGLRLAADSLRADAALARAPLVSGKGVALLELLKKLFSRDDASYRGIVFVNQIALTFPLANLVNQHFASIDPPSVRAGSVSGVGSMSDSDRTTEMDKFRNGATNVLICTNALEEGVDVSDCAFVIRFSRFDTTKSHIQGSGRARRSDAEVYYFDNNPDDEEASARLLSEVAKDARLELSHQERAARREGALRGVVGVYPYFPSGGGLGAELNFFNCLQIVYEYCSKTMGQSFDPEDLFMYATEVVCDYPRQVRRYISQVSYPSPMGLLCVTLQEANQHWGDVELEDLLDPDRCKNLDAESKMKRHILYVVAIRMHRQGLLDASNQPTVHALSATKLACPAYTRRPGLKIKNTIAGGALSRDALGARVGNATTSSGYEGCQTPASLAAVSTGGKTAPAVQTAQAGNTATSSNHKGALNEWALGRWRRPAEELLRYSTQQAGSDFVSTLEVLQLQRSFQGTASSKRGAEQAAAQKALLQLAQI